MPDQSCRFIPKKLLVFPAISSTVTTVVESVICRLSMAVEMEMFVKMQVP